MRSLIKNQIGELQNEETEANVLKDYATPLIKGSDKLNMKISFKYHKLLTYSYLDVSKIQTSNHARLLPYYFKTKRTIRLPATASQTRLMLQQGHPQLSPMLPNLLDIFQVSTHQNMSKT